MVVQYAYEKLQDPALATPPGVVSQFPTTHASNQVIYYITAVLCTIVPGALFLVRLYTKAFIIRQWDWADFVSILSWPLFIALIALGQGTVDNGGGVHQWNVTNEHFIDFAYHVYLIEAVYGPLIFLVKTAILLQYLKTFAPQKGINPFLWWSARFMIIITGLYQLITTNITIFTCAPREAQWNPLITGAKCIPNYNLTVIFTCIFNILSDIFILVMPARAVWRLQIAKSKKVGIITLFAIGLLACIANAMIIYYIVQCGGDNADVTYNYFFGGFWLYAEVSFGMTVAGAFFVPKFYNAKAPEVKKYLSDWSQTFHSKGLTSWSTISNSNSRHRSNKSTWREKSSRSWRGRSKPTDQESQSFGSSSSPPQTSLDIKVTHQWSTYVQEVTEEDSIKSGTNIGL